MPVAEPIVMYVIPGIGWIVKLLEGWTNRLNEYGLIYAGLTGKPFWVSAAKASVSNDRGRVGRLMGDRKGRDSEKKKFPNVSFFFAQ